MRNCAAEPRRLKDQHIVENRKFANDTTTYYKVIHEPTLAHRE